MWDFLHIDSPKRESWIASMIDIIEADLGDSLTPESRASLHSVLRDWTPNQQYALWFGCVSVYPQMQDFLLDPDHNVTINVDALAAFLKQKLPQLCQNFLMGQFSSVDAWVRSMRAEYVFSVPCLS
jgi:hypothetical protein